MDSILNKFDVIICGGGPGGSTAAMAFHDTDLKIAVIEKSNFPRDKVCGDSMMSYIPKALDRISPKFKKAFDDFEEKVLINDAFISSYNNKTVTVKLREQAFIIPRYYFDNFLYEQANTLPNVTFFLEQQVKTVEINDEECTVVTTKGETFTSKMILGCDGSTSAVRKQLTNYTKDPSKDIISIRAYYENVKDSKMDTLEVYLSNKYPEGYLWIFPSYNNQVNVGFGTYVEKISKDKMIIKDALLEIIEENPSLKERFKNAKRIDDFKGWSISLGYGSYPISGKRFMLCGDAASLADPLSGEGIGPAMISGRIAAFHAIRCTKNNDFSEKFMKEYDKEIYIKFGKSYKRLYKLAKYILRNSWLVNLCVSCVNITPNLSKTFLKLYKVIHP